MVAEGRSIVGRRDGEVRALIDVIDNDRALCRAGDEGLPMPAGPMDFSIIPASKVRLEATQ